MLNTYLRAFKPYLVNFPSEPKMIDERIESFVNLNMFEFKNKEDGIMFAYNTIMLITDAKKKMTLEQFIEINKMIEVPVDFVIDVYISIRG